MAETPACGAETRKCRHCGHHQKEHARKPPANTRRGPCGNPACVAAGTCPSFEGRPCLNLGTGRGGRCEMHGGNSLAGMASGTYKAGQYSKVLPASLLEHYRTTLDDPDLLSLREEIALVRAAVREVCADLRDGHLIAERVFTTASGLFTAQRNLHSSQKSGNADRLAEAMTAQDHAITGLHAALGPAEAQKDARAEIVKLTMALERLERSENTRLVELHNMITAETALALQHASTMALLEVLDEHVPDADIKASIRRAAATRLAELAGRRGDPALGPGPDVEAEDPSTVD